METVELNGVPISKETILGWAAKCGVKIEPPKPKFQKIRHCHLQIDVPDPIHTRPIVLSWAGYDGIRCTNGKLCRNTVQDIECHIFSLQKAIEYVKGNSDEM
jgi:hypothetical protein